MVELQKNSFFSCLRCFLLSTWRVQCIFSLTLVRLTFDFPDFAEKVPEDVREQVLMTHLLPCVKVWCDGVTGFLVKEWKCLACVHPIRDARG